MGRKKEQKNPQGLQYTIVSIIQSTIKSLDRPNA